MKYKYISIHKLYTHADETCDVTIGKNPKGVYILQNSCSCGNVTKCGHIEPGYTTCLKSVCDTESYNSAIG